MKRARWEERFDEAVSLAARRRLSATLSAIKRIRAWQHRQTRHGNENHAWHDAELLWLQGVALERARRRTGANDVWQRLAHVLHDELRGSHWFLPKCGRCAARALGFAPSWYSVASELSARGGDAQSTARLLAERATSCDRSRPVGRPAAATRTRKRRRPKYFAPQPGQYNMTELQYAAYCGDAEAVDWWIAQGGDVNAADDFGYTALHWNVRMACTRGDRVRIVRSLAAAGADPTIRDRSGMSVLDNAIRCTAPRRMVALVSRLVRKRPAGA